MKNNLQDLCSFLGEGSTVKKKQMSNNKAQNNLALATNSSKFGSVEKPVLLRNRAPEHSLLAPESTLSQYFNGNRNHYTPN